MATSFFGLLVGIDAYSSAPLRGCVNDIDAIERVLLDRLRVDGEHLVRLAAPPLGQRTQSRLPTSAPTADNLRRALGDIGERARAGDRVFIYYSGHGAQRATMERRRIISREALVPVDVEDGGPLRLLFDYELNALVQRILSRTSDVTMILDCCHSAGIRRGAPGKARVRLWPGRASDLVEVDGAGGEGGAPSSTIGGDYMLLSACGVSELAEEIEVNRYGRCHGALTLGLLDVIEATPDHRLVDLAWHQAWPALVDRVSSWSLAQHPRLQGRSERRVFGGAWQPRDPGLPVRAADGVLQIMAGTLVGVTVGAQLAIYGDAPAYFPPVDSAEDRSARLAVAVVTSAERAHAVAPLPAGITLPEGARARLILVGRAEQLTAELDPFDATIAEQLETEGLVRVVPPGTAGVEATVEMVEGRLRLLAKSAASTDALLAEVGERRPDAMRAALVHFWRYQQPLRLAQRSCELPNALELTLLECSNASRLREVDGQNPDLPAVARDVGGVYELAVRQPVCILVRNRAQTSLFVSLLNCAIDGRVELLGEDELIAGATQAFWRGGLAKQPFAPSLPADRDVAVERLVVIGTTRPDVSLRYLVIDTTFAEALTMQRGRPRTDLPSQVVAERWTAQVVPWRITRARSAGA